MESLDLAAYARQAKEERHPDKRLEKYNRDLPKANDRP
jgi:hypothetical protein